MGTEQAPPAQFRHDEIDEGIKPVGRNRWQDRKPVELTALEGFLQSIGNISRRSDHIASLRRLR